MNRIAGVFLVLVFAVAASPVDSQQATKPKAVTAFDVLAQLDTLFITDKALGHSADETVWVTKQVVELNSLQLSEYGLKADQGNPTSAALENDTAFIELRTSICKQRPHLKIVDSDGMLKPCH